MIKYLLIFLLPLSIYASKILSYNIYDRTDRVDVMITFDTPYEGIIKQNRGKSQIVIKLQDAQIESSKVKKLSTNFLQSITITPMSGYTQMVATVPSSVALIASKTSDSYGLRLRFSNKTATKSSVKTPQNSLAALPTKKDNEMSKSYYLVVAILIIGIIILLVLKNKITKQTAQNSDKGWLFKETAKPEHKNKNQQESINSSQDSQNNISIRFQKDIDSGNSVIMLDFDEQSYLVLMGNSNILLDKFTQDRPTTQEDFDSILQSRHQELDDFLRVDKRETSKESNEQIDALQAYKEKAASIVYTQDN